MSETDKPNRSRMRFLFLCTGHSCRSQMAEGWTRNLYGDSIEVASAGAEKHGLDLWPVKVMAEVGVDVSSQQSKLIDELQSLEFDYIIMLCDKAKEICLFLSRPCQIHPCWIFRSCSTAKDTSDEEQKLMCYRRVRDEIAAFLEKLSEDLTKLEDG